jgi:nucleotide-binding universal stress UspA family protein
MVTVNSLRTSGGHRLKDSRERKEGVLTDRAMKIKRILVPTRLSVDEGKAIDYAVAFASRFGAELTLVYVYQAKGNADFSPNPIDDTIVDENRERAEDALKELCAEISENYPHCDMCFRCGAPSEEIVRAAIALEADLIVASAHKDHGRRQIGKSGAEKLLREAPCAVLVVQTE